MASFAIMVRLPIGHFNFPRLLILVFPLPRLFLRFRAKTAGETRCFEVTPTQRRTIAATCFGLMAFPVCGMKRTRLPPGRR